MARTPNICGMTRRVVETEYNNYETALTRGPTVLGGPLEGAQGISYDAYDISRCFKVFITPAWVRGTYWLDLKHANGHRTAWPCIIASETLHYVLNKWDPKGLLKWAPFNDEPSFDWPRIRHYGPKNFKVRNSANYAHGPCLSVIRQGTKYLYSTRSYPHTVNAMNYKGSPFDRQQVDLLSCRPLRDARLLAKYIEQLGVTALPEQWMEFPNSDDRNTFLKKSALFFLEWSHGIVIETTPNRVAFIGKNFDAVEAEEDREVKKLLARVEALKAKRADAPAPTPVLPIRDAAALELAPEPPPNPFDPALDEDDEGEDEKDASTSADDARRSIEDDEDEPSVEEELEKELGDDVEDLG